MRYIAIVMLTLAGAGTAQAEVAHVNANGFEITQSLHIAAPSPQVWTRLIQPGTWWSDEHTFSGKAANMTFVAKAGACWCETLPNGGAVQHMSVAYVDTGKTLVLRGALGPFFDTGASGAMSWSLKPAGDETDVALTLRIGGYVKDGFEKWAPLVDQVLAEQFGRLKAKLETKP